MRRDAELVGLGLHGRIVRETEDELALREGGVEVPGRQVEGDRADGEQAPAERIQRVGVGENGVPEARQGFRPLVGAHEAPAHLLRRRAVVDQQRLSNRHASEVHTA